MENLGFLPVKCSLLDEGDGVRDTITLSNVKIEKILKSYKVV